jgi:hypothetical protein
MLSLLGILRFESAKTMASMEAAIGALMLQVQVLEGRIIAYEHQQLVLLVKDANTGLPLLRQVLNQARQDGFSVFGSLVQPVATTARPMALSDFTERTVETLYRIHAAVLANEIGLSPKMMSLIELSCPNQAPWFSNPGERMSPVRVMGPTF